MNALEKDIIKCFKTDLLHVVDPITISTTLFKQGDCDQILFEEIRTKINEGSSRKVMWETLLPKIPFICSFASFWLALHSSGYEILSVKLLLKFWQSNCHTGLATGPRRTECEPQSYFLRLKACFHDQAFKEPLQLLFERSEDFRVKHESARNDTDRKSFADRYVDCLCVLIDTQAMKFVGTFPTHNMFDSLKAVITSTSNTSLTEVAYYSRLAIAHGMADNFVAGRGFMAEAQMAAFKIEQNVQYVYNMLYIHIHFLCMQALMPTSDHIGEILDVTKRFLQSLPVQDEGAVFWKKMAVLRIVCFLLGISHKGIINESQKVEKEHVTLAKTFLTEIDVHWEGIEYIRRLFYFVCKARIQELERQDKFGEDGGGDINQQEIAVLSLRAAVDQLDKTIAQDGESSFQETPFAKRYSKRLRNVISEAQEIETVYTRGTS